MSTFLGIPRRASHEDEESPLRGALPFPKAARKALANDQLRRNLAHATSTICSGPMAGGIWSSSATAR